MSKYKILFQLSGSIACYKACNVISKLVQRDIDVRIACTEASLKFIGVSTLEGLTRNPVYIDMFARKHALDHIELAKWYDMAIVCPATANIINKFSAGIADDLISTLFLAQDFSKPYLIAPAMNHMMYKHPSTQNSIMTLEDWGVKFLGPGHGHQACGDEGPGRMLEPELILEGIFKKMGDYK